VDALVFVEAGFSQDSMWDWIANSDRLNNTGILKFVNTGEKELREMLLFEVKG
jgi:hypothetical protein